MRNLDDFAGIASDWFWETDRDHRFTYFSSRMEEVTGIPPGNVLGRRRDQQTYIIDASCDFEAHLDDLRNHRPFRNLEYRVRRQSAEGYMWLRVSGDPVFDGNGTFAGYRGAGHDITEEREAHQRLLEANEILSARNRQLNALRRELELAAYEDTLTGLPNRRAFDAALSEHLGSTAPDIALLLIDLDKFKRVNDTMGHPVGDLVLMTAADRIATTCRQQGEVYRIGGDEFAAIVADCPAPQQVHALSERIIDAVSCPTTIEEAPAQVGASIGVAFSHGVPTSPHRLYSDADKALYAAKSNGCNTVRSAA